MRQLNSNKHSGKFRSNNYILLDALALTRKPKLTFFSFLMQKAAEMREKIKILQNEIEILRSKVNAKDRLVMLVAD